MYNPKDIQFVGKHDYDDASASEYAANENFKSFSINIFKWELASSGKIMKRSKGIVRVSGPVEKEKEVFNMAENVVNILDKEDWDGRKTVVVK